MRSKRIDRLSGSLIREILQVTQRPEVISFAGGLPAAEIMPAMNFAEMPGDLRQYGPSEGEPRLRELIAQQLCNIGRTCAPDQVLVTAGSQQGIDLISKLFIDEGTVVALESPTYLAALQSFRLFGAEFLDLHLSADGVDPETLRTTFAKKRPAFVYLIPNFQNPSGACYSEKKRRKIAAILDEYDIPLVEDDPYRELMYDPVDRTPISAFLKRAPWLYLGSFSKTTCPGLRIGYLACSQKLFPFLARLKQASDLHSNRPGQWWLVDFISSGKYERHIEGLRPYYRNRRDLMHAALTQEFSEIAEWETSSGGLFFWVKLKQKCDTRLLLKPALARNVAFMPGEPFFANAVGQSGALRLNFSHSTPERIEQGVSILSSVVRAFY